MQGSIEKSLLLEGKTFIGVDEVGRGCIAGPVYVAAAALDFDRLFSLPKAVRSLIRDSKTLSRSQRQKILPTIMSIAIDLEVASSSVREIETLGIVPAINKAIKKALRRCNSYDVLLFDGKQKLPFYRGEQRTVVDGDLLCYTIAAASIAAKEARDAVMIQQGRKFPGFEFESNVGYGTKRHRDYLLKVGPSPIHRKNFAPVKDLV